MENTGLCSTHSIQCGKIGIVRRIFNEVPAACHALCVVFFLLSGSAYSQTDPNNDPSWDWRNRDTYTVYLPQDNGMPRYTTTPFDQGGTSVALQDNDPADGWILLMRDFGRAAAPPLLPRGQPIPHFILYNRFQGLLRVFLYIDSPDTFSDGGVELFHGSASQTALLTYLKPRASAADQLASVGGNRSMAATPIASAYWSFADFPIAYDPYLSTRAINPQLFFRVWGLQNFAISLTGRGDLRQVFGTNQPANIPSDGWALPGSVNAAGRSAQAAYSTWQGWSEGFKKTANNIDPKGFKAIEILKGTLLKLGDTWVTSNLGLIGAGVGLVDFLVSGGRRVNQAQPAPMNFQLGLTLSGTMESPRLVSPGVTLPVPGVQHTVWPIAVNVLSDKPLGVFNLLETPIIQFRSRPPLSQRLGTGSDHTFDIAGVEDLNRNVIPPDIKRHFWCDYPNIDPPHRGCYLAKKAVVGSTEMGSTMWWLVNRAEDQDSTSWTYLLWADRRTIPHHIRYIVFKNTRGLQLQVKNSLRWQINPASGLKLESLSAAIVFRAPTTPIPGYTESWDAKYLKWSELGTDWATNWNSVLVGGWGLQGGAIDPTWVQLESATGDSYLFRNPYVDAGAFRFHRIDVPELADVAVKVKAILRRTDGLPSDQPVVFVATYQPTLEAWNYVDPWPTFDLNGNACIDRGDLDLLMNIIRGTAAPDPFWKLDLNGDGKIDVNDARALIARFNRPNGQPCINY